MRYSTVAELALGQPAAILVLERLKIDYCCHGTQSLAEACRVAGITSDELISLIEQEPKVEIPTLADESLQSLMKFIVGTHHVFTKQALDRLQKLTGRVREKHQERHAEVIALETLVDELAADLRPHMLKEEQVLFPYVEALESAIQNGDDPPQPFFGTVKNPIRMMLLEHDAAAEKLSQIRNVTREYTPPTDACPSFIELYELLESLENDLHRHIHLENNLLFPKAAGLEEQPAKAEAFDGGFCGCGCNH